VCFVFFFIMQHCLVGLGFFGLCFGCFAFSFVVGWFELGFFCVFGIISASG